jgi:UPF0716 protein FxsA
MIRFGRRASLIMIALFVVLPIVEITLLVVIGRQVGTLPVLVWVLGAAVVGGWLIRNRWRNAWRSLSDSAAGSIPLQRPGQTVTDAVDTALGVFGGLALIFPGVITDLVGLICLLPFTRALPRRLVTKLIDRTMLPGFGDLAGMAGRFGQPGGRRPGQSGYGDVIEGEVVEEPGGRQSKPGGDPLVIRGEIDDR